MRLAHRNIRFSTHFNVVNCMSLFIGIRFDAMEQLGVFRKKILSLLQLLYVFSTSKCNAVIGFIKPCFV